MRPVIATRTGACALPGFIPWASAIGSNAALRASAVQSHVSYAAIVSARMSAASSVAHAFDRLTSSYCGDGSIKKSTTPGASDSTVARCCTNGAIARNQSWFHTWPGCASRHWAIQGSAAAAKCWGDIARMYSPLNAASFFRSKNAGDFATSSSRKAACIASHGWIS
ncbi:unannotated protein [freshwater metagenome]|uniref:Unannotated protein n=1 Tax=freshwater metagenome TaxID=449393 RepID=A0A6J6FY60_9ZZZZ